ncbi:MAG: hypothetical protein QM523_06565 [Candidatus Pacebacteria bacterium]|nr:hypothetical protein [Candidatus Paceibacterota bacterium]
MNLSLVILVISLFFGTYSTSYAYIDPITGSLLVQGIIAVVLAGVAGVKRIRTAIIGFFVSLFKKNVKK